MGILEQMEKAGAHLSIAPNAVDREQLSDKLHQLRNDGHAIVIDETFDHQRNSLGITFMHYLNCTKCKGDVDG